MIWPFPNVVDLWYVTSASGHNPREGDISCPQLRTRPIVILKKRGIFPASIITAIGGVSGARLLRAA